MASFSHSLSQILILSLVLIFVSPSYSLPRSLFRPQKTTQTGLKISLIRRDSDKNITLFERVQNGIKRGELRLQNLNKKFLSKSSATSDLKSPVYHGNGEFLMNLSIGTPPEPLSAIVDTGSDLIWTQCEPCENCFSQTTSIFDPRKSSSYTKLPCSSNLCEALPSPSCGDGCEYVYEYGDSSSTQGVMAFETFTFDLGSASKIGFGCGDNNRGIGFQGAGLIGLGRGPLSLVSQLEEPRFSYCLTSIDSNKSSTLLMGSLVDAHTSSSSEVKTTPLIQNPENPSFYYLSLEGISVGGTRLPIENSTFALNDNGSGGLIIDSGTTVTHLEESAFDEVKKAFNSKINLPVDKSDASHLDLCYKLPKDMSQIEVPSLVFHFQGADLEFPSDNYFITDSSLGVMCLTIVASSGMSIFGNMQQQNVMVVHDLAQEMLSFVPTQCDKM